MNIICSTIIIQLEFIGMFGMAAEMKFQRCNSDAVYWHIEVICVNLQFIPLINSINFSSSLNRSLRLCLPFPIFSSLLSPIFQSFQRTSFHSKCHGNIQQRLVRLDLTSGCSCQKPTRNHHAAMIHYIECDLCSIPFRICWNLVRFTFCLLN